MNCCFDAVSFPPLYKAKSHSIQTLMYCAEQCLLAILKSPSNRHNHCVTAKRQAAGYMQPKNRNIHFKFPTARLFYQVLSFSRAPAMLNGNLHFLS